MAKFTIKHICGHESTVQLYGKQESRDRKAEWLRSKECFECEKAEKARVAREKAEKYRLPELQGSEKQITWALQIRDRLVEEERRIRNDFAKKIEQAMSRNENTDRIRQGEKELAEWDAVWNDILKTKTSASYWIDQRSERVSMIIKAAR